MTKPASVKNGYGDPARLEFPQDEARHPWLALLLEAYYIVDQGVDHAVAREVQEGRTLACSKGCAACCRTHTTIPVYPLELVGLSWYVTEKVRGPQRDVLKRQLRQYIEGQACPMLVDGVCAVHPVRPIACRQFNVFGTPCAEGEDAYYTRRQDVMNPIKKTVNDAFFVMLPFYGMHGKLQRRKAIESGQIHKLARLLQACNWKSLAEKMDAFDAGKPAAPASTAAETAIP